jgi:hypothetical protein
VAPIGTLVAFIADMIQECSQRSKRIWNIHRGPEWFINAQNSIIPNSLENEHHQCVELGDSFPTTQKLPQTEFVCKSYD